MSVDQSVIMGLDIGGTTLDLCIGRRDGHILASRSLANDVRRIPSELLQDCLAQLAELRAQVGVSAAVLGVTCPGPWSVREGKFLDAPNMPRWHNFELQRFLAEQLDVPVAAMHDAKASVLAEHYWGAAQGVANAVFLTFATGMGAGLLVDGRVVEGAGGFAGEVGHIALANDGPVGYGRRGTVEGFTSGPGIVQMAESEALACRQRGEQSELREAARPLTPEVVLRAAREGDPAALRVVDRSATALGRLMAVLTDVLNPELFILGTLGMAHGDLFIPRAREVLTREALSHSAAMVRIEPSSLPDRAHQAAVAVGRRFAEIRRR